MLSRRLYDKIRSPWHFSVEIFTLEFLMSTSTNDSLPLKPLPTTTPIISDSVFADLPDRPLVTMESRKTWLTLDPHGLWEYRELLYFLTWRDLKIRYKQTALGVAWVVMQPLMMTLIFTVFLGK